MSEYPDGLGSDADMTLSGSGYGFQATGKLGYAIQFSGYSTGVGTTALSSALNLSPDFTVAFWIYNTSWSGAGSTSQMIFIQSGAGVQGGFRSTSWKTIRYEGTYGDMQSGTVALGTWYHNVIRMDGGNSDFWVDGVQQATDTGSIGTFTSIKFGGGNTVYPSDGLLDEFGLWTRAISDAEIATLYNSGTGVTVNSIDTTGLRIYYDCNQASNPITNMAIP